MTLPQGLIRTGFTLTNEALVAWKSFNGIMVTYKPAEISVLKFQDNIAKKFSEHFKRMVASTPRKYVSISGPTNKEMTVKVHMDYARHPLALGPAIEPYDIRFKRVNSLGPHSSGVLVMGVNDGINVAKLIEKSRPTKLYRLKGILGQGSSDCFTTGKIVVRSSYKHVKRYVIDKVCSFMQSSHQKKIFGLIGVDIQSETAYKLAIQGPIKPIDTKIPMLYSIKCVDFNPPEFTLEVVCINETEDYLKVLINTLGLELHTNATCTQIKCLRFGFFDIGHAMLTNEMDLETVFNHIRECDRLIRNNRKVLKFKNPILEDEHGLSEKHQ